MSLNVADLAPWPVLEKQAGTPPCRTHPDPDIWFPDPSADPSPAKSFCRTCPIMDKCFSIAVERQEPSGVWGGRLFKKGKPVD